MPRRCRAVRPRRCSPRARPGACRAAGRGSGPGHPPGAIAGRCLPAAGGHDRRRRCGVSPRSAVLAVALQAGGLPLQGRAAPAGRRTGTARQVGRRAPAAGNPAAPWTGRCAASPAAAASPTAWSGPWPAQVLTAMPWLRSLRRAGWRLLRRGRAAWTLRARVAGLGRRGRPGAAIVPAAGCGGQPPRIECGNAGFRLPPLAPQALAGLDAAVRRRTAAPAFLRPEAHARRHAARAAPASHPWRTGAARHPFPSAHVAGRRMVLARWRARHRRAVLSGASTAAAPRAPHDEGRWRAATATG